MRYASIDVLRGVAILLMVQVHFVENLSAREAGSAWLYDLANALGQVAAPLFTFLAGVSFALWSRKQAALGQGDDAIARVAVRRGLFLFGAGIAFNVLVWLPEDTFNWDVLTLIGSGLLLLAFARRVPPAALAVAAGLIVLVSPLLRVAGDYPACWTNYEYSYDFTLRDVLWGFVANGYFPLFPWVAFPLVGYLVGIAIFARPDRPARWVLPTGLVLMAAAAVAVGVGPYLPGRFARHLLGGWGEFPASTEFVVGMVGLCLAALVLLHRRLDRVDAPPAGRVLTVLRRFSAYSLTVYLLHHAAHLWPLWICGAATHPDDPTIYWRAAMGTPLAFALAVAFLAACVGLLWCLERFRIPAFEALMRWVCD